MRSKGGFTLVEVIVALSVGALVVLIAERLFAAVADGGRELREARVALDREANAHRWLAAAFLSVEAGPGDAGWFDGHPERVTFSSWQETAEGWYARERVTLTVSGGQLVAMLGRDTVALVDSAADLALDYLLELGADAHWTREWISAVSAPLAVRIRFRRPRPETGEPGPAGIDTLLFLIKERG